MSACEYVHVSARVQREQKKMPDALELELWAGLFVSHPL